MSKEFYFDIPTRAFHSYSKRKIAEKKGVKEAVEVSKVEDGYFLHLQSEHSLRRASMTLREMFQRAKDLSAKKIVLTEYQTMSSCIEAYDLMMEYQIPISVGTEIKVHWKEKQNELEGNMLLIPVDKKGYGIIGKILSEGSQGSEESSGSVSGGILRKWLAPGSCGHLHVMVTTGGTDGILFNLLKTIPEAEELLVMVQREKKKLMQQNESSQLSDKERILQKNIDESSSTREKMQYRKAFRESKRLQKREEKYKKLEKEERRLLRFLEQKELVVRQAATFCDDMAELSGKENFYVELCCHGRPDEKDVLPLIVRAAGSHQLLSAEEARYSENSREDKRRQELQAGDRRGKQKGFQGDFSIRPMYNIIKQLGKILPGEVLSRCEEGMRKCCERSEVFSPPEGTHYPVFPGEDGKTRLQSLVSAKKEERYPDCRGWTKKHEKRLQEEMNIITKMGFSDYFCIVEDLVGFIHDMEKKEQDRACYIGPGRGSAVGSLTAYILGITSIDPVKEELLFTRFLNPMRVTAPDIDLDIAPEIYERVMRYMREKYGEYAICAISTKMRMGALQALEYAGAVHEASGQLIQAMKNMVSETGNLKESEKLKQFAAKNKKAEKILGDAYLLEGRRSGTGQHPSGVVLSDTANISSRIPLMFNEHTGQWMTQFDMEEVERMGLLKLDLLKLRTLDVITETLRIIGKNVDLSRIPVMPEVFQRIFGQGETVGVFQLESDGMRRLLKEFQPTDMRDLTLLISIYRPGPLQYADKIIRSKREGRAKQYPSEKLNRILKDSYGYPVYQEEIMQIFHEIGGLSLEEADIVRRAIAKKDTELLETYRTRLVSGLIREGIARQQAQKIWSELLEFGKYSFNRSHAAAYAKLAYITAYLKCYYLRAYLCALFNHSEKDRIPILVSECRRDGIRVLPPDLALSEGRFLVTEDGNIRFGLCGIKGMSAAAVSKIETERQQKPFSSMKDFLQRGYTDNKTTDLLILSGAMDGWTSNRKGLMAWYPTAYKYLQDLIREKELHGMSEKAILLQNRFLTSIQNVAGPSFSREELDTIEEKVLGFCLSSRLNKVYVRVSKKYPDIKRIAELSLGENRVFGTIQNLRILKRKRDGKEFAAFVFSDDESEVEAVCFADRYEKLAHLLKDGKICVIRGKIVESDQESLSREKLIVQDMLQLKTSYGAITISIPTVTECENLILFLKECRTEKGTAVFLRDRLTGHTYKVPFPVSEEVWRIPWNKDYFPFREEKEQKDKKAQSTIIKKAA